jgi:hypothetical protein
MPEIVLLGDRARYISEQRYARTEGISVQEGGFLAEAALRHSGYACLGSLSIPRSQNLA